MSVRSLNKVMLIGNLTRDPELRYTPSGTAVCNFGLATNRQWTSNDGNTQEATEFHRIVAWSKLAEICSQLLFKGRKIYVEGRLQTREWASQDGNKQRTTEVVADTMMILDSRRKEEMGEGERGGEEAGFPPGPVIKEVAPEPAAETVVSDVAASDIAVQPEKKMAASDKKKKDEVNPEDLPF